MGEEQFGTKENSPAFQGWENDDKQIESRKGRQNGGHAQIVAVRKDLSSLMGLLIYWNAKPSAEALGYFHFNAMTQMGTVIVPGLSQSSFIEEQLG